MADLAIKVTDSRLSARQQEVIVDTQVPVLERAAIMSPAACVVAKELKRIGARPIGDKILVMQLPKGETFSSIIIPEDAQAEEHCGIVIAAGSGYLENGKRVPLEVRPGNYVVYGRYAASEIEVGGQKLVMIREEDIRVAVGGGDEADKT